MNYSALGLEKLKRQDAESMKTIGQSPSTDSHCLLVCRSPCVGLMLRVFLALIFDHTTAAITPAMQGAGKWARHQEEEEHEHEGAQEEEREEEVGRKGGRKSAEEAERIYTQKS